MILVSSNFIKESFLLELSIESDTEFPTIDEIRDEFLNWHAEDRQELEETRKERVHASCY